MNIDWKKVGIFAGGFVFGTAGLKVLTSRDAKNVYVNTTAAVLRAKDTVMTTADKVKENCEDILAEAYDVNAEREEEEVIYEYDGEEEAEAEEGAEE